LTQSPTDLPALVLASASPRRQELLASLDVEFRVRPADLDESALPNETPEQHVRRLAREKSRRLAAGGELVLAADTVVVIDGEILGKPQGEEQARQMLEWLNGRWHTVFTGVALTDGSRQQTVDRLERSEVEIGHMTDEEIGWYVSTGEPLDKAGSYAIQGLGALFVAEVRGNYTNVVGLPLPATQALFRDLGFDLRRFSRLSTAGL
jgi:septum formation protein